MPFRVNWPALALPCSNSTKGGPINRIPSVCLSQILLSNDQFGLALPCSNSTKCDPINRIPSGTPLTNFTPQ